MKNQIKLFRDKTKLKKRRRTSAGMIHIRDQTMLDMDKTCSFIFVCTFQKTIGRLKSV